MESINETIPQEATLAELITPLTQEEVEEELERQKGLRYPRLKDPAREVVKAFQGGNIDFHKVITEASSQELLDAIQLLTKFDKKQRRATTMPNEEFELSLSALTQFMQRQIQVNSAAEKEKKLQEKLPNLISGMVVAVRKKVSSVEAISLEEINTAREKIKTGVSERRKAIAQRMKENKMW